MANRFLSRAVKDTDDDDLVRHQLSALENVAGKGKDTDESTEGIEQSVAQGKATEQGHSGKPAVEKKSIIEQDVIIKGSISSSSELVLKGTVNGDVSCEKEVTITGSVEGNVKAGNVQLLSGYIHGDIESKTDISILKGASVNGNISANTLCCDGKIEGNSTVNGKAVITENAVVIGDILCEKISIREGAVCNGNIQTNASKMASSTNNKDGGAQKGKDKAAAANVTDLKRYI